MTTSEKEIVDNLFLMASEEPDMDDEIPDTQMCSVSWKSRILREINFWKFRSSKNCYFDTLEFRSSEVRF